MSVVAALLLLALLGQPQPRTYYWGDHAGQPHNDVDFTRDDAICKIDRFGVILDRHFTHRWTNMRLAAKLGDQFGHLSRFTAFQRRDG